MSFPEKRITHASGVMHAPPPPHPPDASPRIGPEAANGAGSGPDGSGVMRDAAPMGVHHASAMRETPPENASPTHHPASDAITLAFRLLEREGVPVPPPLPRCVACSSRVARAEDVICPTCYRLRRPAGPGVVALVDPLRRARVEARLAVTPCGTCGAIDWYVSPRGDSACRPCARARAAEGAA